MLCLDGTDACSRVRSPIVELEVPAAADADAVRALLLVAHSATRRGTPFAIALNASLPGPPPLAIVEPSGGDVFVGGDALSLVLSTPEGGGLVLPSPGCHVSIRCTIVGEAVEPFRLDDPHQVVSFSAEGNPGSFVIEAAVVAPTGPNAAYVLPLPLPPPPYSSYALPPRAPATALSPTTTPPLHNHSPSPHHLPFPKATTATPRASCSPSRLLPARSPPKRPRRDRPSPPPRCPRHRRPSRTGTKRSAPWCSPRRCRARSTAGCEPCGGTFRGAASAPPPSTTSPRRPHPAPPRPPPRPRPATPPRPRPSPAPPP